MAQLSYALNMVQAMAGMLADLARSLVDSFAAEGIVRFGYGVIAGTDASKQVKVPAASGGTFRGVALHVHTKEVGSSGYGEYADEATVSVMREGRVHVPIDATASDAAVVPAMDGAVYLVFSSAEGGVPGTFRADTGLVAASANQATAELVTGAVFRGVTANGLAEIELVR